MKGQVTKHFSWAEVTRSQTANRLGIRNQPSQEAAERIEGLCQWVLEPVRSHFGRPVRLNSCYRGPALNKAVGGSPTSNHVIGCAADLEISSVSNGDIAEWIRDSGLEFDELILEAYTPGNPSSGWVHVAFRPGMQNRYKVLTWTPGVGYRQGLVT